MRYTLNEYKGVSKDERKINLCLPFSKLQSTSSQVVSKQKSLKHCDSFGQIFSLINYKKSFKNKK